MVTLRPQKGALFIHIRTYLLTHRPTDIEKQRKDFFNTKKMVKSRVADPG